jgi:transposase
LSRVPESRLENGVRGKRVFVGLVGVEKATVEDVWFEPAGAGVQVVVAVRAWKRHRSRCGACGRRCPGYDPGRGRRRWRTLDLGTIVAFVEADAPRVRCHEHGVVVAAVPWAAHDAGHTRVFDQQVSWLAVHASKSAVTQLMRIAWRTVGSIITRVLAQAEADAAAAGWNPLDGLRRIGIDEISYRRGQKYVVVVVDHDTGRLVWAGEGRTKKTVRSFFDQLGPDRSAQISHVSADGADYIGQVVAERCPAAVRCADPFHVVAWVNDALARVRIDAWNQARVAMRSEPAPLRGWHMLRHNQHLPARDAAKQLRGSRFALAKNPENLTEKQQAKLDWVAANHPMLWRAYQLKEALRGVFGLPPADAADALQRWLSWARRCRIPAFVELQRRIRRHQDEILAAIEHQMSNALIESVNTKIRLLTRVAFGFHSAQALIAIAMLSLGPHRPALPGR